MNTEWLHHDYHGEALNSESVFTKYGCQCGGLGSPTCAKVTSHCYRGDKVC